MFLFKNYFNIFFLLIFNIVFLSSFIFYDAFSESVNQTETPSLAISSSTTNSSLSNIANNSIPTISKIDIEVGKHPYDVLYNPSNNNTYVTNSYSKTISIISGNQVVETIPLNFNPWKMAYDPYNSNVYVTTLFNNTVLVMDSSNNILKTIDGFSTPNDIAYNPDTKSMYITNSDIGNSSISVINVTNNSLSSPILLEKNYLPTKIIYNPINHYMYIAEGFYSVNDNQISKNRILVLDVLNNTVVDEISLPGLYSNAIAYDPFYGYVYVGSGNTEMEVKVTEVPSGNDSEIRNDKDTNLNKADPLKNVPQGIISIINSTTNTIVDTIPNVGYEPSDIVYNPKSNMILVTDMYTNSVRLIDSKTNDIIANIPVGSNPTSLAYSHANGMVYVVNSNMSRSGDDKNANNTVSIIDFDELKINLKSYNINSDKHIFTKKENKKSVLSILSQGRLSLFDAIANNTLVSDIHLGLSAYNVKYNPINGYLYVTNYFNEDKIYVIGTKNYVSYVTSINGDKEITFTDLVFNPGNRYLYVSNNDYNGTVSVIDTKNNNTLVSTIPVEYPSAMSFNPDNGYLYVSNDYNDTVSVIDTNNNQILYTIPVNNPEILVINPDNGYLYVSKFQDSIVSVIDTNNNNTLVSTIQIGHIIEDLALNPDKGYLYVSNVYDETVSVIDTKNNNTLVSTIPVEYPSAMSFNPDNGYLYVSNFNEGTVSVIDTSNNYKVINTVLTGTVVDLVINPETEHIYTINYDTFPGYPSSFSSANPPTRSLKIIDPSKNPLVSILNIKNVLSFEINPDTGFLYMVTSKNIQILDTNNNNTLVDIIPINISQSLYLKQRLNTMLNHDTGFLYIFDLNHLYLLDTSNNMLNKYDHNTRVEEKTVVHNPKNGYLYVSNNYINTISVIDTNKNNTLVSTITVEDPSAMNFNPKNGYLYVSNNYINTISVIDTNNNNTLVSTIPVEDPSDITLNPDTNYLYVSNFKDYDNILSVINLSKNQDQFGNTLIDKIYTGNNRPSGLIINPDNDYLYVNNYDDGTVSVIDTNNNNTLVSTIPVEDPSDITLNPDTNYLYVSNFDDGNVSVIDTDNNNTLVSTIPVGNSPYGLSFNPDDDYLYVSKFHDNTVSVIDTNNNNTLVSTIPVGNSLYGLAFNPDNDYLYVSNSEDDIVSVIDTNNNNSLVSTIPVGNRPSGLIINPDNDYLYVNNYDDGTVSVIDTDNNNTLVSTIPVGNTPSDITLNRDTSYLYVNNFDDGAISVINPSKNRFVNIFNLDQDNQGKIDIYFNHVNNYLYINNQGNKDYLFIIDTNDVPNRIINEILIDNVVGIYVNGDYIYHDIW